MGDEAKKNEMTRAITEMEFALEPVEDRKSITGYTKISLDKMMGMGAGFGLMADSIMKCMPGGGSGIYKVSVPKGMHLAKRKDGSGYIGGSLDDMTNKVSGQATFNKVSLDPTMVCMAAMMASVNKRLDSIEEAQKEMMDYLKQKDKSEVRGNIKFLADIMNNYKYNWDSERYKDSNHVKALDIKQDSESKIDFYRNIIMDKASKKSFIQTDQSVRKQVEVLKENFREYKLSLYMFAFSSLLEVMLLENYEEEYLGKIIDKVENYLFDYKELYSECYNDMESNSKGSVQANLVKGIAKVGIATSKLASKTPGIKKTSFDESLSEKSEKLYKNTDEKRAEKMQEFADDTSHNVRPFIECLKAIQYLYNKDIEMVFDGKNVYLECA